MRKQSHYQKVRLNLSSQDVSNMDLIDSDVELPDACDEVDAVIQTRARASKPDENEMQIDEEGRPRFAPANNNVRLLKQQLLNKPRDV